MSRFRFRMELLVAALAIPGVAQAQARSFGPGKAIGVTVQAVTRFSSIAEPVAVGIHFAWITESGPEFDFGIATIPAAIGSGAVLLVPDVGIGHAFPIGGGALMLKAGPSVVVLATGDGSDAWWGLQGGAIAFVRLGRKFGFRLELVPRVYWLDGERLSGATIGLGFTSLPTRAR